MADEPLSNSGAPNPTPPGEKKETTEEKPSFKLDLYFTLQALAGVLVPLLLIFALVARPIRVDGTSMVPTLHDGDLLILRSIAYTPKQGDIVVLRKESFRSFPVVKRVIATAGQHVHIDYAAGTVSVDGVILDEPYIYEAMHDTGLPITDITVPEGSIFVMGDNRNHSDDSRNPSLGAVDTRYVIGQALFILFPFSDFGPIS